MRLITVEEFDLSDYCDYYDSYGKVGQYLGDLYTCKLIYSELGYLDSSDFESQWLLFSAVAREGF